MVKVETMRRSIGLRILSAATVKRFFHCTGYVNKHRSPRHSRRGTRNFGEITPKRRPWERESHQMDALRCRSGLACAFWMEWTERQRTFDVPQPLWWLLPWRIELNWVRQIFGEGPPQRLSQRSSSRESSDRTRCWSTR